MLEFLTKSRRAHPRMLKLMPLFLFGQQQKMLEVRNFRFRHGPYMLAKLHLTERQSQVPSGKN